MKIIGAMIVFNEASYIDQVLRFLMPIVDEVAIIDGPFEKYPHNSVESDDGTLEIIKTFHERYPHFKSKPIHLVTRNKTGILHDLTASLS